MGSARGDAPAVRWPVGAAIGVLSGAIAIGTATLAAGLIGTATAPVLAVGAAAVDGSPEWLKRFAIDTFGTDDKTALLLGIGVVLTIAAVVLGIVSLRRPRAGIMGLIALGVVGALAAVTRPENGIVAAVPSLAGTAAALWAYLWLRGRAGLPPIVPPTDDADAAPPMPVGLDRRRFLFGGAVVAGLALAPGFVGEYLVRRSEAAASRSAVRLPTVSDAAAPTPPNADLHVDGEIPFITPNEDFYRVDTALFVPAVQTDGWALTVHGMVDRPLTLDFDQLVARPLIERDITLCCVSNEVGGRYIGNARWTGTLLAPLLQEAGIQPGVTQLVSRSTDGFTTGTPASVALDGRDAMLVVAMNGEPLPLQHGFPVRMVIPGLYGYESACKWITDIEATTYEAYSAYWVERGWAQRVLIKTESRIDVPKRGESVPAGPVTVAGIAWAQHRGISTVEIQIDGGAWARAKLGAVDTIDTWRQWRYDWEAAPGGHTITVRATDGDGMVQTDVQAQPFPSGATGLHQIPVTVT